MCGDMAKAFTAKMQRFCTEYLKDLNGKQAAIRAGYPAKSAKHVACRILKNREVKRRIDQRLRAQARKVDVGVERILRELESIGFSNILHYYRIVNGRFVLDVDRLPEQYAAAISSVKTRTDRHGFTTVEFSLTDKLKALEALGRYHKMFTDKMEIQGSVADRLAAALERTKGRSNETVEADSGSTGRPSEDPADPEPRPPARRSTRTKQAKARKPTGKASSG